MKTRVAFALMFMTASCHAASKVPPTPAQAASVVPVVSPEAQESCKRHAQEIDSAEKLIALAEAQGVADDSAPRHTNRMLEEVVAQQRQQMHIALMINEHCSAIPSPEGGRRYILTAMDCRISKIGSKADADQKCKMADWSPAP